MGFALIYPIPQIACPSLQVDPNAEVNVVGGYGAPRPRNDPYSNNYNPGWRDHPNFRWRDQANQQPSQPRPPFQQRSQDPQPGTSNSTEDMLLAWTKYFTTHVQATESSIKNLEKQVGQMVEAITRINARTSGNLPSQTVVNPRENVSAITL